ncbi:MAG: RnfABCDGE type electron transport complex subunit D [Eubacteriales bacterium]|nr:RnfABCDGE type electron transport complex subunit D [Eubacteriales bacterium]
MTSTTDTKAVRPAGAPGDTATHSFHISASPHIRSRMTTGMMMTMVILALLPTTVYGVIHFGLPALWHVLITIATCVLTEYLYQRLMKRPITVKDGSAALTGLLLALNLPPAAPLWFGILGGVFAILIVKQLFGGLGQNIMNPALAARCFLLISFTGPMTDFHFPTAVDAISAPTALATLKADGQTLPLLDLLFGRQSGTIGEVCALALLIGGFFLIAVRIIDYLIPLSYIGSFVVFLLLLSGRGFDPVYIGSHVLGGGLLLGAFFMATDYVTAPITRPAKVAYGVIIGLLTCLFRLYGGSAEGVSYAIIFTNLLVPLLEKLLRPHAFGKGRQYQKGGARV